MWWVMNHSSLQLLSDWAYKTYGLVFNASQQKKIVTSVDAYLAENNLKIDALLEALSTQDQKIIKDVIDILTVQESYFFRDASLFLFLKQDYLPKLIQSKRMSGNLSFTIWSAGCAGGEEIYSIAMLLLTLIPDINEDEFDKLIKSVYRGHH